MDNSLKTELSDVKAHFTQEGNTLGTTATYEELSISLKFVEGEKEGPFYVIKSETGWSFDSLDELKALIEKVERILDVK